ncbi:MAG: DinB family protein [Cytophagaceae bacterium]
MGIFIKKDKEQLPPAEKIYKKFLDTAKYLLKELDYYGPNQFKKVPENHGWSIGQVYDHLVNGTRDYYFKEIKNCLDRKNGDEKGDKRFKGTLVFVYGSFPPVKIKGINIYGYEPSQPESTAKMKDEIYKFIKEMQKVAKEIDASGNTYKTKHPSLGMLTALEWYALIEMHFRHHLRQKKEMDKFLRSFTTENSEENFAGTELDTAY